MTKPYVWKVQSRPPQIRPKSFAAKITYGQNSDPNFLILNYKQMKFSSKLKVPHIPHREVTGSDISYTSPSVPSFSTHLYSSSPFTSQRRYNDEEYYYNSPFSSSHSCQSCTSLPPHSSLNLIPSPLPTPLRPRPRPRPHTPPFLPSPFPVMTTINHKTNHSPHHHHYHCSTSPTRSSAMTTTART